MKNKASQKTVIIILAVLLVLALIFACVQLSKNSALRTQLSETVKNLDSRDADLTAASEELESAKGSLSEVSAQHEESMGALSEKETALANALDELERTKAELESTKAALEDSKAELESTKAALEDSKAELESAIASLSTTEGASVETADKQSEHERALDDAKAELEALNQKLQENETALRAKESEIESVKAELEAVKAEQQATAAALAEAEKALAETEAALAKATAVHVHTWGEWETDIIPGCESEGREIRHCTDDPSHEETRLIPAAGHEWQAATFTQPKTCVRCGETSGDPSPETSFPTLEEIRSLSQNSAIVRVSNTDKTRLQLPSETSYLSEPYRAKLSNNIYLMPIPELGHGHLGIVNEGTEVAVVAKRGGYVFFVTYDGRMGWNGSTLVS